MQYCDVITYPRWRTDAIFKIVKSPYLSEKSSDFDEIWYTASDIEPGYSHWPKIAIFEIQDGGGCHLENRLFGHYSLTDCPISANFSMRKQNGMLTKATGQKMQILRWRTAAILKIVKSPYLSEKLSDFDEIWYTTSDIEPSCIVTKKMIFLEFKMAATAILKFDFLVIIYQPIVRFRRNFVWGSRLMACRQRSHDKNCKFSKSNMADGRHFENR